MALEERTGGAEVTVGTFEDFVAGAEARVRRALVVVAGPEAARDATADALLEVWRRWDKVQHMANPTGYLYTVARRRVPRRSRFDMTELSENHAGPATDRWVEPGLLPALRALPESQRVAVYLVAGCGWTAVEVADLTGVAATTVRTHLDRGITRLRTELGATEEDR